MASTRRNQQSASTSKWLAVGVGLTVIAALVGGLLLTLGNENSEVLATTNEPPEKPAALAEPADPEPPTDVDADQPEWRTDAAALLFKTRKRFVAAIEDSPESIRGKLRLSVLALMLPLIDDPEMTGGTAPEVYARIQFVEDQARKIEDLTRILEQGVTKKQLETNVRSWLTALDTQVEAAVKIHSQEPSVVSQSRKHLPPSRNLASSTGSAKAAGAYARSQKLSAEQYLQTVTDGEVLQIAQREYPADYSMQKYVYDTQLDAKRYMQGVADREVQQIALRGYPADYSMQKFVYDQQLTAKRYMQTSGYSEAKARAQRDYPSDYTMQKFVYDQSRGR